VAAPDTSARPDDSAPPDRSACTAALADVALFADLPASSLEMLSAACSLDRVPAGTTIVREGEPGDEFFVVASGLFDVVTGTTGEEHRIRQLRAGAPFGELALLSGIARTASVRAVRDSVVWRITRAAFTALVDNDLSFARAMNAALTRMVIETDTRIDPPARPPTVIAIVAGHADAPVAPVLAAFSASLGDSAVFEPGEQPRDTWGPAVDALERAHGIVLLHASFPDDEWFDFCVRESDRVVVVVDAANGNASSFGDFSPDLVCWGSPSRPTLTRLLADLHPRAHHIVASNERDAALGRAARRVASRSMGIVLSGGGARGLAHIGVLRELEARGIAIDRYGGTSMGALIGALAARGLPLDHLAASLRRELVDRKPFSDFGVPKFGLIRAQRARAMLERFFASTRIEELPRDFFCISADLVAAETVVHRRGDLVSAVGASMSLPGLAPPVKVGDQILVDGGVLDNLPVTTMAAAGDGPVIAVDVLARGAPGAGRPGRSERLPTIVETLARSATLSSRRDAENQRSFAALTIVPDLAGIGLLDFAKFGQSVDAGKRAAQAALRANVHVVDLTK
jgi:predicted acylesterase/phospholipase RssA